VLEFFARVHNTDSDVYEDLAGYDFGCAVCYSAFVSFDDFAQHVEDEHPHTDFADALITLLDGVPVNEPA
jgi:hypothetical protein